VKFSKFVIIDAAFGPGEEQLQIAGSRDCLSSVEECNTLQDRERGGGGGSQGVWPDYTWPRQFDILKTLTIKV